MEEERNIITFFCFSGANGHGVGNSEMVYCAKKYKASSAHSYHKETQFSSLKSTV